MMEKRSKTSFDKKYITLRKKNLIELKTKIYERSLINKTIRALKTEMDQYDSLLLNGVE